MPQSPPQPPQTPTLPLDAAMGPPGPGSALPAVIPPKPPFAWRRLVAVAAVVIVLIAAALFTFRREIQTLMSYEAKASTPIQVTTTPPPAPTPTPSATPPASPPSPAASASSPAPAPASVVRATGNTASATAAPRPPQTTDPSRPRIEVDLSSSKIDVVDGRYVVRGQIVNNGKVAGSTTQLRLTFRKNEEVLGERSFPLVEGPLAPGGRASFSQTLDDPPPSGTTDVVPVVE